MICPRLSLCVTLVLTVAAASAAAADTVTVVVAKDAPQLERFAASELAGQFRRLFDAEIVATNEAPADAKHLVLIGSPHTNPAVKEAIGDDWPEILRQGIVLKSFQTGKRAGIVVGGGSPPATLWAVYELGHRLGVRYVLREDFFPPEKIPLKLDGYNVVMQPNLPIRTWRTVDEFAYGPESWGIEGHRRLLGQLAKMKFNSVMISLSPWQPFVHYELDGVAKTTGVLWHGETYRVDGDTPYKPAFNGAEVFNNPDFADATTYEQRVAAGTKLVNGIINEAHRLGMTVGLAISPLEFPKEFAAVMADSEPTGVRNDLLVVPGVKTLFSKRFETLVAAKIRAYLAAYPNVDMFYLKMPEALAWGDHAADAWRQFISNDPPKLGAVDATHANRINSNVAALAFLKSLLTDQSLLKRPDGKSVALVVTQVHPGLGVVIDQLLPRDAGVLIFADKTSRRVAQQPNLLKQVPAGKVRSQLYLTLADKGIGILPQSDTASVAGLVEFLREQQWNGFCTRYWVLGELDGAVHYLSRASFDETVTPRSTHDDLFVSITGKEATSDRLWKCFNHIAAAAAIIDENDATFAFPAPDMMMKHYVAEPIPDWWGKLSEEYTAAMVELFRARGASHPRSKDYQYYYAKRGQFVAGYLACVKAVREAALAKKSGDAELAVEKLEAAIEAMYDAINALGEVARDQSDLGLMAVLTQYAYRPLLAELEKLEAAE